MRILFVTTVSMTINYFLAPHIKMLQEAGHAVELACNMQEPLSEKVQVLGCRAYDIPFERNPLDKRNILAYEKLRTVIRTGSFDVVHTHTPTASVLVRMACKKLRKQGLHVFYTAHGFHFYSGAPIKNWLIYYPIEKLCSKWTDVQITITKEDYKRAIEKLHADRTVYIPGVGVDLDSFSSQESEKAVDGRRELPIPAGAHLLLSVGELNENKNHCVVLEAMHRLQNPHLYYVVCGEGLCRSVLTERIREFGLSDHVFLLGQRRDVPQWMAAADVYVHPSLREGLSVSIIEAMASGLPVICGDIRGNRDLIQNEEGGFLFDPNNSVQLAEAIRKLLDDKNRRVRMGAFNQTAAKEYSQGRILERLHLLYEEFS